jgi:pimeloyl-ACP methyl ester carboxylesterase
MAETLFMIHGMMVGAWCWDQYKTFFTEKGYQCITPDLRYHNVSPTDLPDSRLGKMCLLDYVEDLKKEILKLDRPPIIMGHSMGGLLAQILGARGLAKALILLTPASPYGINGLKPCVIKTFWSAQKKFGFWRKPFRLTFNEVSNSMLQFLPLEEKKNLYNKLVFESGKAASQIGFWRFDKKRTSHVDESKITVPVLVISGSHDKACPASVVKNIAAKYAPVSTYREFKDHSHWVIGEPNWQDITNYIAEWLMNLPNGGR